MGIMDGTMAKDDNQDMERMQMLTNKMSDGTITDAERDELAMIQNRGLPDSGK